MLLNLIKRRDRITFLVTSNTMILFKNLLNLVLNEFLVTCISFLPFAILMAFVDLFNRILIRFFCISEFSKSFSDTQWNMWRSINPLLIPLYENTLRGSIICHHLIIIYEIWFIHIIFLFDWRLLKCQVLIFGNWLHDLDSAFSAGWTMSGFGVSDNIIFDDGFCWSLDVSTFWDYFGNWQLWRFYFNWW